MKVLVCGGRDYCEFYTQSDAEAVMKNLKNNISAKDKLIQSLIDFDSEEVKRLEDDNKRLREEIAAKDAEIERLREALNYYANISPISYDMGHTARAALSGKERQETGNE